MRHKNTPNLIQSTIIHDRFPNFPYNSKNTPTHQNFLEQKQLIEICYRNLFVKPSEYGENTIVPLAEIQKASQIQNVAKKLFETSKETLSSLKKHEKAVLNAICHHGITGFREIDFEILEERITLMQEGKSTKEEITPEFVEKLAWELKNTRGLESYIPKYK